MLAIARAVWSFSGVRAGGGAVEAGRWWGLGVGALGGWGEGCRWRVVGGHWLVSEAVGVVEWRICRRRGFGSNVGERRRRGKGGRGRTLERRAWLGSREASVPDSKQCDQITLQRSMWHASQQAKMASS